MEKRPAKRCLQGIYLKEKKLKTEEISLNDKSMSSESQLEINLDEDALKSCKKALKDFLSATKSISINVLEVQREVKIDARYIVESDDSILTSFDQILKGLQEKMKKNWHKRMKGLFASLLLKYSKHTGIPIKNMEQFDWIDISKFFYNIQEQELREKLNSMLRHNPTKEIWDPTEDELLVSIVTNSQVKNSWKSIARELFQKNPKKIFRSSKHCRERWLNHLNPDLNKDQWTLEEDIILLRSFLKYGRKWACIANELKGRTPCKTKNRFIHLQWVHDFSKTSQNHIPEKAISEIKVTIMKLESSFLRKGDTPNSAGPSKKNEIPARERVISREPDHTKSAPESSNIFDNIHLQKHIAAQYNGQSSPISVNMTSDFIQRSLSNPVSTLQNASQLSTGGIPHGFNSINTLSNSILQNLQINIALEMQRRRSLIENVNQNYLLMGQHPNQNMGLYLNQRPHMAMYPGNNSSFSLSNNGPALRNTFAQFANMQNNLLRSFNQPETQVFQPAKMEEDEFKNWAFIKPKEEEQISRGF